LFNPLTDEPLLVDIMPKQACHFTITFDILFRAQSDQLMSSSPTDRFAP